jgi:hypothetical protein
MAAAAGGGGGGRGGSSGRSSKRKKLYAQHKTAAEVAAGIAAGRLHQGALRASRFNPFDGWVSSEAVGQDILISGRIDMNRAIDGKLGGGCCKGHLCVFWVCVCVLLMMLAGGCIRGVNRGEAYQLCLMVGCRLRQWGRTF